MLSIRRGLSRVRSTRSGTGQSQSSAAPLTRAEDETLTPVASQIEGSVTLGREWSIDIIGLPHNAVRKELHGLRIVAAHTENVPEQTRREHLAWTEWLAKLVEWTLGVEEQVLYPWICAGGVVLPESLSPTRRAVRIGRVKQAMHEILSAIANSRDPSHAVNRFADVVFTHFAICESVVPQLVRSIYTGPEKPQVLAAIALPLSYHRPELFALLARGYNEESTRASFTKAYGPRRLDMVHRMKVFDKTHAHIVEKLGKPL